jgi:cytochrome c-type biogenesis protein
LVSSISIPGAALAGLLSFASPCVLPLVPPYLCYLAGVSFEELSHSGEAKRGAVRGRIIFAACCFVLGFSTVFVALGATASVIGSALRQYSDILSVVAGLVIIVFGLHFLGLFRISLLFREARLEARRPAGPLGAYVMGLAFAFGWTPCIGPALAAILSLAGREDSVVQGAGLLAVYSAGLGIPFLVAAAFAGAFLRLAGRLKARMGMIEKAMGALLVVTGLLFLTGQMSVMSFWLLETFPALGRLG